MAPSISSASPQRRHLSPISPEMTNTTEYLHQHETTRRSCRVTPRRPPLADTWKRHDTKEISQYAETFLIFGYLRLNYLLHAKYNLSVDNHFASIDHVLRSRVAFFLRKTHDVLDPLLQAILSGEYGRRYLERATSGTMTDYLISDPPKSGNEFRLSQENSGD